MIAPAPPIVERVALWSLALDGEASIEDLARLLDDSERTQASAIASPAARARFIAVRAFVRTVLADALDAAPESLAFERGRRGKPRLVGGDLAFNLSHAADVAVLAVTRGAEVGVDVEALPRGTSYEHVSERCFAPAEARSVRDCDPAQRPRRFATLWTAKEAYLKLTGEGLSRGLGTFVVDVRGDRLALVSVDGAPPPPVTLHPLDLGPGRVGMLCAPAGLEAGAVRSATLPTRRTT